MYSISRRTASFPPILSSYWRCYGNEYGFKRFYKAFRTCLKYFLGTNKAVDTLLALFPSARLESISGNACTDKKPSGKPQIKPLRTAGHLEAQTYTDELLPDDVLSYELDQRSRKNNHCRSVNSRKSANRQFQMYSKAAGGPQREEKSDRVKCCGLYWRI